MENNCPKCGSPFKTVPAGVSKKTGKPYPEFTACSKYGCDGRPGQPIAQPVNNSIETAMKKKEESIDKAQANKNYHIKEAGAIRIAGDYANLLLDKGLITKEEWQDYFKKKANEVYKFRLGSDEIF